MALWLVGKQLINKQLGRKSFKQLKLIYFNNRFLSTTNVNFVHDPLPPLDPKKYGGKGQVHLNTEYRLRPPPPKSVEDFANPDQTGHWVSYGFDEVDRKQDRQWYHMAMFVVFTIFFPILTFYFYYEPDFVRLHDWVTREAYLELSRREKHGLPLVDPDYVPKEKMLKCLPAEEEINIDVHY